MDDGSTRTERYRSMTCERDTAAAMTRALVRVWMLRPTTMALVLFVGGIGVVALALEGYLVGAAVFGVAAATAMAAVLAAVTYRRMLRATQTLYPEGATVSVDLDDAALTVRTAVSENQSPYSAFAAPRVIGGPVSLPLRAVHARVLLPAGLLSASDVDWLRDRIIQADSPEAERPSSTAPARDTPVSAGLTGGIGGEVLVTEEMAARARREVLRHRLRGRGGLCVLLLTVGLWLEAMAITGRGLAATALALLLGAGLVLAIAARITRTMRRTSGVGRRVRTRFDDTHLHLEVDGAASSLAYSAIRRCVVGRGVVLLTTATGLSQVLPRELVPDEAVQRMRGVASPR